MRNIGIMGGTFNPIHIGHLIAAQEVLDKTNMDRIIFIPVGKPPHKMGNDVEEAKHRLEMVKLAIKGNDKFFASDMEIKRHGRTYTYDTLNELHNEYEDSNIYFIIGYDTLKELDTWKRITEVFKLCSFIVVNRNNDNEEMKLELNSKRDSYNANISVITIPSIEISSTDIRNRIIQERSIKYLVPDDVSKYIFDNGLYRGAKNEGI